MEPGLDIRRSFVFERGPFRSAHAATLAETPRGLLAAWFAGTREGHGDVAIWLARREGSRWLPPVLIADGRQGQWRRFACWNPVLFQYPHGPLMLFYKVGPSPSRWWGMVMSSHDHGETWSRPHRLPEGILGPIKNKPILLPTGVLLCPGSCERQGWRVHVEWTADHGQTWHRGPPLNDGHAVVAIQPSLLPHADGRLQLLCRSRNGAVLQAWSEDQGRHWSALTPTTLPNPDSGIDAVMLADHRALLAFNDARRGRTPLALAVSHDGEEWRTLAVLERGSGEFSYPAIIQARDGTVHVAYTWNRRRIAHAWFKPAARDEAAGANPPHVSPSTVS